MPKKDIIEFRTTPVPQTTDLEILFKPTGSMHCSEFKHFTKLVNFLHDEFSEEHRISVKVLDDWIALSMTFEKKDC